MSTSGIDTNAGRTAFRYLLIGLLCALFGAVYERFSHGVYSYYMIYAFVFPLAGGALPFAALSLKAVKKYPGALARGLYHCGIAALTVGSIVSGILEIYGTGSSLVNVYWIAGLLLAEAGIAAYLLQP